MAGKRTETLTKLIELLEPLNEHERKQTVNAAMTFLQSTPTNAVESPEGRNPEMEHSEGTELPRKATNWLKQSNLELASLEDVFHFSGDGDEVEVIAADVPGSSARQKAQQCYLLVGVKNFLSQGEPKIDDQEARRLCQDLGCFDSANHSKAVKDLGNMVTGSKARGFVLTAPGLRAAAELLKQLVAPSP